MSAQPQSVLRTSHSLRGIVAHLLVETQYCWVLTDKQPNETDGEKTITWRALPDAEGEKFVCGRRGAPLLKGGSVAYGHSRMPPNAGPTSYCGARCVRSKCFQICTMDVLMLRKELGARTIPVDYQSILVVT